MDTGRQNVQKQITVSNMDSSSGVLIRNGFPAVRKLEPCREATFLNLERELCSSESTAEMPLPVEISRIRPGYCIVYSIHPENDIRIGAQTNVHRSE